MSTSTRAIVVLGPTASGKSDLALTLAESGGGEIVNCDSLQLYRHLQIGTAKTPLADQRGIPHHLCDILEPDQVFTAGDYQRLARTTVSGIASRGRVPIVVGGTGFYLRALTDGLDDAPARDDELRARLSSRSGQSLHRILCRLDPASARRIHPNDVKKLIRALEVSILARKPMSALHTPQRRPATGFDFLKIGLDPPRDELALRINQRCEAMYRQGLIDEVRSILQMGFSPDSKALESIGYRESLRYLAGEITLEQAVLLTQAATRQYAKRQRTWFRREPGVRWFPTFGNHQQTIEEAKRLVAQP